MQAAKTQKSPIWSTPFERCRCTNKGNLAHRDYKDILQSSLADLMRMRGMPTGPADGEMLLACLRGIPSHPEVPAALAGVPVDFVITAQQAKAYKPDHQLFRYAHAAMGVTPDETIHVGMGQFTDLKVCTEMGIRSVWIDRLGEPLRPEWAPDAVLPNLGGLPALLGTAP